MYVKFVPLHKDVRHLKVQVDQEEKITSLKDKLKDELKSEHFKILFHGRTLHDVNQTLTFYKMNPTSTIHVIETNPPPNTEEEKKPPNNDELEQFKLSFELALRKDKGQSFMKAMQRLSKRENLGNICQTCPELTKDPIARAFLSKPELICSLLDGDGLKSVYERHPGIIEAATQLAQAVLHEEKPPTKNSSDDLDALGPFAYSLDDSDDEDEDMETEDSGRYAARGRGSFQGNTISADQLANALAAAGAGVMQGTSSGGMGGMTGFTSQRPPTSSASGGLRMPSASSFFNQGASSSGSRGSGSGPGITQDQLNAALAIALGESLRGTPPPASRPEPNIIRTPQPRPIQEIQGAQQLNVQQRANFESQLATMRELGITDMDMATRALQIMGGDVQAAINLIYSGWNGEGDSAN